MGANGAGADQRINRFQTPNSAPKKRMSSGQPLVSKDEPLSRIDSGKAAKLWWVMDFCAEPQAGESSPELGSFAESLAYWSCTSSPTSSSDATPLARGTYLSVRQAMDNFSRLNSLWI